MTLALSSLSIGAIYAIVAIGYNIVFVSSGVFNFANAQLITLGSFVAFWGLAQLHQSILPVILIAAGIGAIVATIIERVCIRTVKETQAQLVTTVGAASLTEGIIQSVWGTQALAVPFLNSSHVVTILGGRVLPIQLWLIGAAVVVTAGIAAFLRFTRLGVMFTAMSEDRDAAEVLGINVRWLALAAFAMSGAVGGVLGMFVGAQEFAVSTLGDSLALYGFVAIAIGGFGSFGGGLAGGLAVGLIQGYSIRYIGTNYGDVAVFAVLLLVLMLRPSGLFVRQTERSV